MKQVRHAVGVAALALAILLLTAPAGVSAQSMTIQADVSDYRCVQDHWTFYITNVPNIGDAPETIDVSVGGVIYQATHWADTSDDTRGYWLNVSDVDPGLNVHDVSATATIYEGWTGRFYLAAGLGACSPAPTTVPTDIPTIPPTLIPTDAPTDVPTLEPTVAPTDVPTLEPTAASTNVPTLEPTRVPTNVPTLDPTSVPTNVPTSVPTGASTSTSLVPASLTPTATPTKPAPVASLPRTGTGDARGITTGLWALIFGAGVLVASGVAANRRSRR
ncbi:MAG: hypothetical protein WBA63_06680 [Thermomicrobiales bacterium]